MRQYLDLLQDIMDNGTDKSDRTGVGTRSVFGRQLRFDLAAGFPLLTTKKVHLKSIIYELLWFLRGDTNVKWLQEHGVTIWDEWADEKGDLGPVYGEQWRFWRGADTSGQVAPGGMPGQPCVVRHDQIGGLLRSLRNNPDSRRHIVSAWNVTEIERMAMPPCHCLFQFYVADNRLSCQLYQRSADVFLGVPFNIASYALLTMMIAQAVGFRLGDFVHTFGDVHIYQNHFEQVATQLSREPRELPKMLIVDRGQDLFDFRYEDFVLQGYDPHPRIEAPVAV